MSQKPVVLEDLDREELLQLVRQSSARCRERDLLWAMWEVANDRSEAASQATIQQAVIASERLRAWRKTEIAAKEALASGKSALIFEAADAMESAQAAYFIEREAEQRLQAKWDRLTRRADRLYDRYQALCDV